MSEYEYGVQVLDGDTGEVVHDPQEGYSTLEAARTMCERRIAFESKYGDGNPGCTKLAFRIVRRKIVDWEPYDPA